MDDKLHKELVSNLKEAAKVVKGESKSKAYVILSPADIKEIRSLVKMSQAEFAREFQLKLDTLKGWEQGKRQPDSGSTNYLRMIKADPDYVREHIGA